MRRPRLRGLLLPALLLLPRPTAAQAALLDRSDFRADMRDLWEDHVAWTRFYIVASTAKLPEKDAAAKRLLKNQDDIAAALKPFYGDTTTGRFSALLKEHVRLVTEMIEAALSADNAMRPDLEKRWGANADSLSLLLSRANPGNWPLDDLKSMLHSHLDLTTAELLAHFQKDWNVDVAAYDKVHDQALKMADLLSSGIIRQFPRRFR